MLVRRIGLVLSIIVMAAACGGGDGAGGGADGSWEERLALLPLLDHDDGTVEVSMGDLAVAAELAEVDWPPAEGGEVDSFLALAGARGSAVAVPIPFFVQQLGPDALIDDLRAEAGWALDDLDWLATAAVRPTEVTVGAGRIDADAIGSTLGGDGPPWRVGSGEDLDTSLEDPHLLDSLGRPVTMTVVDGVLGFGTVADSISALEGEGPTMAEVEPVRRLVALADERGCYGLTLAAGPDMAQMVCSMAEVDAGPQVIVAAVGIEDPVAEVERIGGMDSSDTADSVTVTADEDMVIVEIDAVDDLPGSVAQQLLFRLDPLVPGFG